MEKERLQRRPVRLRMHIKAGLLFLTTVVSLTVPVFAADSVTVTVSCYTESVYLGDVGDVVDVTTAARLCNMTYADCSGRCIGCFHDFHSDTDICLDNQGRKVLKR